MESKPFKRHIQTLQQAVRRFKITHTLLRSVAKAALMVVTVLSLASSGFTPYVPYEDNPADPPDVKALKADFAKSRLGREMLVFAKNNGIAIRISSAATAGNYGVYSSSASTVYLKEGLSAKANRVFLAHELRHAWQHKVLGYDRMEAKNLTPEQRWTQRRYIEADARAFSTLYLAERMAQLHEKYGKPDGEAAFELGIAQKLKGEINSWHGLSLAEYREIALSPSFTVLLNYNSSHLHEPMRIAQGYIDKVEAAHKKLQAGDRAGARSIIKSVEKAFARKTPDAEFIAYLRRFGGTSFDPAVPTSLQGPDVSEARLRRDYARKAIGNDEAIRKVDETLNQIAVKQKVMEDYIENFNALDDEGQEVSDAASAPPPSKPASAMRVT